MEAFGVLEDFRRESKRKVKADAIKQFLPAESEVATGTSDFVEFMKDRRTSYFYVEGKAALGSDVVIDIYFRTVDSSNGAGALLDTPGSEGGHRPGGWRSADQRIRLRLQEPTRKRAPA